MASNAKETKNRKEIKYPINFILVIRLQDNAGDNTLAWSSLHLYLDFAKEEILLRGDRRSLAVAVDGEACATGLVKFQSSVVVFDSVINVPETTQIVNTASSSEIVRRIAAKCRVVRAVLWYVLAVRFNLYRSLAAYRRLSLGRIMILSVQLQDWKSKEK